MLPPCLLLASPLCAGYRLHLLSIHGPSSELLLALLRHPGVCLTWRLCWVQILCASPTWVQILHASPASSTTFPFVAHQACSDEQRTQIWGFFYRYSPRPRVQHSPCTSEVTAKANPSINPTFLALYSLSLTSIYLHSEAPGELSDLKRLESARKDEFPFTTGRLRK